MKYYFISGLPRSGSTLLSNILAQNPKFHSSATSGILDVMFTVRNSWDNLIEFKASPNEEGKKRVLKGILDNYYALIKEPVVFDKSRGWLSLIEMAEYVLDEKVKILVPIRDMRDVLSSFEKLYRKRAQSKQSNQEKNNYFAYQTVEGRTDIWLHEDQPVGLAHNRIRDALARGLGDRLHFVRFENLTSRPKETLKAIYDFLGEEQFEHNFDFVNQVTTENDEVYGFEGLHDIRPKVEAKKSDWMEILGAWADKYKSLNF